MFLTASKIRRYRRLERFADSAAENKQYSAAVNAEYRSGQLAGLNIDKKEAKVLTRLLHNQMELVLRSYWKKRK